ncbi:MAG: hypothetical protein LBH43_15790 [Treponema sp.]|jgi:hypothetical protein|nr:hypothetical protein [Treponema sp.]
MRTILVLVTILSLFCAYWFSTRKSKTESNEIKNRIEIIRGLKQMSEAGELTEDVFNYIAKNNPELKALKSQFKL